MNYPLATPLNRRTSCQPDLVLIASIRNPSWLASSADMIASFGERQGVST